LIFDKVKSEVGWALEGQADLFVVKLLVRRGSYSRTRICKHLFLKCHKIQIRE